ncbi:MAG: putative lipid II flippase FtsW [Actinomycetota bacterium]|nr:putative lipid II flippase FtsW [Actinomycetota bacterium]
MTARRRGLTPVPSGDAAVGRRSNGPRGGRSAPSSFLLMAVLVAALNGIGLVMVLSASSVQSLAELGSTWGYFTRQATWLGVGTAALACTLAVDYRRWRRLAVPLLALSGVLLVVVLSPLGVRVNGAQSWLALGPARMQPAELAKLALLLFCADLLARRAHRLHHSALTLRPILVVGGGIAGLMMLQPDLGTTIVLASIVVSVLFLAGVPLVRLTGVLAVASAAFLVLAMSAAYRRDRILAFLHPSQDPMNTGYQLTQSLTGVASGGVFGVGLGASRAKYGFLPNAHTDFIFAIISEELGLLGALLVLGLFVGFAVLGVRIAMHAPDRFGMLVAGGITAWLLAQAAVNVGGVLGLLPITGLTLPYISFGGSSLVVTMAATGILLNIARQGGAPGRRQTA